MAIKLAIVVSDFSNEITGRMEKKAQEVARENKAEVIKIVHVPGAYDIPLVALELAKRKDIDGVVALGAIIKGETGHDEVIAMACAKTLAEISLAQKKPISLGIIGPVATYQQAQKRAEEYSKRAVQAALRLVDALKEANE